MNRELARKRPAVVVREQQVSMRPVADMVVIRDASRTVVASKVSEMWRAGQIRREYDLARVGDVWVARVFLKPAPGAWRRWGWKVAVAAIALAAAGVFLLVFMKAIAVLAGLAFAAAILWLLVSRMGGNHYSQTMNIHH